MCGRVIQSSAPIRLAILEGMDVRDSRFHNYPPRWNGAPSQELLVIRRNRHYRRRFEASAALARRCLQNMLHKAGYKAKDLAKEVDLLLNETDPNKVLPLRTRETVDAIRNFGNFSAHPVDDTAARERGAYRHAPVCEITRGDVRFDARRCYRRSSSGSLAMLAAIRRASPRVSKLAAVRRPGSCSK